MTKRRKGMLLVAFPWGGVFEKGSYDIVSRGLAFAIVLPMTPVTNL